MLGHNMTIGDWIDRCSILIAECEQLREKIDDYKSASLLEISGDPADIEPHHIENEITSLRKHLTTARDAMQNAIGAIFFSEAKNFLYEALTKLDADSTTNNSTNNEQDKATSVAKKHTRYHNGEWINDEVDR